MEKLNVLYEQLKLCYQRKVPFVEDYVKLGNAERNNLCASLREEFKNHLNSDELRFSNLIKAELENIKSIFL
jgi:hypothetical protein